MRLEKHWAKVALALCSVLVSTRAGATVTVRVDGGEQHQILAGFGGSVTVFEQDGIFHAHDHRLPAVVTATAAQRRGIARLLFRELGITRARAVLGGFEPENDDADPAIFDWDRFSWRQVDGVGSFVAAGLPLGLRTPWLSFSLYGHEQAWLRLVHDGCQLDPARIEEAAEWILAPVLRLRDRGVEVPYLALANEPDLCDSGAKIPVPLLVQLTRRVGERLRGEGLETRLVISDGWVPENALVAMRAVLDDPQARGYVGALAFHSYDFYGDPAHVLAEVAAGGPPAAVAAVRREIRDLAAARGLPVWMTEVCYCVAQPFSDFELLRARMNHLFDELTITDVAAFDVMNLAFLARPRVDDELVHLAFDASGALRSYQIAPYGLMLAHLSRYAIPESVRVKAASSDARVRAVAFRRPDGRPVVALLHNGETSVRVRVRFTGIAAPRQPRVVTSRERALFRWQAPPVYRNGAWEFTLPPRSLTSLIEE